MSSRAPHRWRAEQLESTGGKPSAFAEILQRLLPALPGAYAAAFVDAEGECIDHAGGVDPYHIMVAGAHMRVLLEALPAAGTLGALDWLVLRGSLESVIVGRIAEQYAITVLCSRGVTPNRLPRAVCVAMRELADEGALQYRGERWYPARFTFDERERPLTWHRAEHAGAHHSDSTVEVVGTLVGLSAYERGYRLRVRGGAEVTAVRESSGLWFTDDAYGRASVP